MKQIKYTPKYVREILKEAKEIGCNLEFSPKALENLIKQQRDEIIKEIHKLPKYIENGQPLNEDGRFIRKDDIIKILNQ